MDLCRKIHKVLSIFHGTYEKMKKMIKIFRILIAGMSLITCSFLLVSCGAKKDDTIPYEKIVFKANTVSCLAPKGNISPQAQQIPDDPKHPAKFEASSFDSTWDAGVSPSTSSQKCQSFASAELPWNDPLLSCQWHWRNRGEFIKQGAKNSYYKEQGYLGADLKLLSDVSSENEWIKNLRGEGYKVHISDSGVQFNHEDLAANFDPSHSYDFCNGDKYPEPRTSGDELASDSHGTEVSGVIAAVADNGKGVVGIASKSSFSLDNIVSKACSDGAKVSTWLPMLKNDEFAAWNGSFGTSTDETHEPNSGGFEMINDVIDGHLFSADQTDDNKTAYFKASGNERYKEGQGNNDPMGWNPWIAQIGSVNEKFGVSYYSNPGPNLLVTAFGAGESYDDPGICTTNANNNYVCNFNGTSAATPQATGLAVLIKEAGAKSGKQLSPIDIYYIMARTAIPVDEYPIAESGISNKPYINYSVNSAGYWHSVDYGFGVLNAKKAIELAANSNYNPLPPLEKLTTFTSSDCGDLIFKTNESCAIKKISVTDAFQIFTLVASVDVRPNYAKLDKSEQVLGQIFGFIIQPDGTKSELLRTSKNLKGSIYNHAQLFKSYAAMGAAAQGDWYVELCAHGLTKKAEFDFKSVKLKFFGWKNQSPLPSKTSEATP